MIFPAHQKNFLEKLYSAGSFSLAETIRLLSPNRKPAFEEIDEVLNLLWVENLFAIHARDSDDELWLEQPMLEKAEEYVISLKGLDSRDNHLAD